MARIHIDLDDFIFALEDRNLKVSYYLDIKTGDVISITGEDDFDEDYSDVHIEELEENPERYFCIDKLSPGEQSDIVAEFISAVVGDAFRQTLADKPIKTFKKLQESLRTFKEETEKWHAFHRSKLKQIAEDWLSEYHIEAELTEDL